MLEENVCSSRMKEAIDTVRRNLMSIFISCKLFFPYSSVICWLVIISYIDTTLFEFLIIVFCWNMNPNAINIVHIYLFKWHQNYFNNVETLKTFSHLHSSSTNYTTFQAVIFKELCWMSWHTKKNVVFHIGWNFKHQHTPLCRDLFFAH